ncbi:MAG: sigma-70 family RNA polymerase sigma factor [bacterium]
MNPEWDCFFRCRQGDEEAWRVLTEKYRSRLLTLALLITGSGAAAEDVVQETFVRALGGAIKNTSGTVHGFLGTIAFRLAVKETQRMRRYVRLDALERFDHGENPMEQLLKDERQRFIAGAIGSLNVEHRDVLLLRCYGGHSYEEIAKLLKVPIGTVKSRIFYAVKSCRDILRRKGMLE